MKPENAIHIGTRRELLVDDYLVESVDGAARRLHAPERREVALTLDAPWENNTAAYFSVLQEEGRIRLYYRAGIPKGDAGVMVEDACTGAIAESFDGGLSFTRPELGVIDWGGNTQNNLYHCGDSTGLVSPFLDTNPACKPEEKYKALSHAWLELYTLASPDGVRWHRLRDEKVDMPGEFDTLNTAFFDPNIGEYRSYTRYYNHLEPVYGAEDALGPNPKVVRCIQSARSNNFTDWARPVPNFYHDTYGHMQFYINNTVLCPGAEHLYLAFPSRYVQERQRVAAHPYSGVNDVVLMASRDGVHWTRHPEAWVRPGLDDACWTDRNNFMAWGIVQTSPTEWSMYVQEHYRQPDRPTRLRRLSVRPHGFASMHADFAGGTFTTKPLVFDGTQLRLNYATSAIGSVRVEVLDAYGRPLDGLGAVDMAPLFGDALDETVCWETGADLSSLCGMPVRLRFHLNDADLFSFRTQHTK